MLEEDPALLGPFLYNSTIVCFNTSRILAQHAANYSASFNVPTGELQNARILKKIVKTKMNSYCFTFTVDFGNDFPILEKHI